MAMRRIGPVVAVPLALAVVLLALSGGGCTSTHVTRAARFEPAAATQSVRRAPQSAAYKVKYADVTGGGLRTVGGTKRIVGQGDPLGFALADDGTVVAIAGAEQIPLDDLPPTARYCVWIAKEQRPTQFSREVGKATLTVGGGLLVGALAGAEVLGAMADSDDDCDDASNAGRNRHHRHHRHGKSYRWVGANDTAPDSGKENPTNKKTDGEP
jgi:hypothetical protein